MPSRSAALTPASEGGYTLPRLTGLSAGPAGLSVRIRATPVARRAFVVFGDMEPNQVNLEDIQKLIEIADRYGLEELTVAEKDLSVTVRGTAPGAPAAADPAETVAARAPAAGNLDPRLPESSRVADDRRVLPRAVAGRPELCGSR